MSMFTIMARLGFDGSTFHAGVSRANSAVQKLATGTAHGMTRAMAPWFGLGMFSRMFGMMKQFADSGDEVRKKWEAMGVRMSDDVFNSLVRASRQFEQLKVQIISAVTPLLSVFVKMLQASFDFVSKTARIMGAASTETKGWQWLGAMMPGPMGQAFRNMILGGEAARKAGEEYDVEKAMRDALINTDFIDEVTKKAVKQTKEKPILSGGIPVPGDELSKIGGFMTLGAFNDSVRISKAQLDRLETIARNTSELKGIP